MTTNDFPWIPTSPATEYGTNALIDARQQRAWIESQEQTRTELKPLTGDQYTKVRDMNYREVKHHITALGETPGEPGEQTRDLYGRNMADVDLLAQAGQINQPLSDERFRLSGPDTADLAGVGIVGGLASIGSVAGVVYGSTLITIIMLLMVLGAGAVIAEGIHKSRENNAIMFMGPKVPSSDGTVHRSFVAGTNAEIAALMHEIYAVTQDIHDPLWGFYEELVTVAEEAAAIDYIEDPEAEDKARIYNRTLESLAENIRTSIDERTSARAEEDDTRDDDEPQTLTAGASSAEDADLLQARLMEIAKGARRAREEITLPTTDHHGGSV